MKIKSHNKGKPWSNDQLRKEASKYKTRGEFSKESKNAYIAAYRRGIIDEICPVKINRKNPELEIEFIIICRVKSVHL